MKKYLTILLSVIIILQCNVLAGAIVHNDDPRYTVDLPEEFQEVQDNKFISSDKSNFLVSFSDNTQEKLCVEDMSDKDVKKFAEDMAVALNSVGADMNIKVVSAEKIKHNNGKKALVIVFEKTSTSDVEKNTHYQKTYMFSGEENIVTFAYTTRDKAQLNAIDSAFDSIVVNEPEIESKMDKLTSVAIGAVVVIVGIIGVVLFVKRRNR